MKDACFSLSLFRVNFGRTWRGSPCDPSSLAVFMHISSLQNSGRCCCGLCCHLMQWAASRASDVSPRVSETVLSSWRWTVPSTPTPPASTSHPAWSCATGHRTFEPLPEFSSHLWPAKRRGPSAGFKLATTWSSTTRMAAWGCEYHRKNEACSEQLVLGETRGCMQIFNQRLALPLHDFPSLYCYLCLACARHWYESQTAHLISCRGQAEDGMSWTQNDLYLQTLQLRMSAACLIRDTVPSLTPTPTHPAAVPLQSTDASCIRGFIGNFYHHAKPVKQKENRPHSEGQRCVEASMNKERFIHGTKLNADVNRRTQWRQQHYCTFVNSSSSFRWCKFS